MSVIRLFAGVLAAASLAAPLAAQAAPQALFSNTLIVKNAAGSTYKVSVNADGTYNGVDQNGVANSGTWAETGDQMCFTPIKPAPAAAVCTPKITQAVGASWTAPMGGAPANMSIVAGR